jgi:hypothetical protein
MKRRCTTKTPRAVKYLRKYDSVGASGSLEDKMRPVVLDV